MKKVSRQCIDFMLMLLTDSSKRLGKIQIGHRGYADRSQQHFPPHTALPYHYHMPIGRGGVEEIKAHPWFDGLDWSTLRSVPAPYVPEGSHRMKSLLTDLKSLDPTSPEYIPLIRQLTSNFDDFKEDGTIWGSNIKSEVRKDKDNQFIGYTFKRKKV